MKPFEKKDLLSQNKIQHFLKSQPKENAIIEINNILSDSKLDELPAGLISEIEKRYQVLNSQEFYKSKKRILEEFLNYKFSENDIKKINYQEIQVISNFLEINEKEVEPIFLKYSKERFIKEVENIIQKIFIYLFVIYFFLSIFIIKY